MDSWAPGTVCQTLQTNLVMTIGNIGVKITSTSCGREGFNTMYVYIYVSVAYL